MSYIETSRQSYGSRMGSALCGIPMGIILVLGAGSGIWWNEGRSVYTAKAIAAGMKAVVEAPCDEYLDTNEGKLIHVACKLNHLGNHTFLGGEIRIDESVFAKMQVEMFQWYEKTDKDCKKSSGGSKTCITRYMYRTDWRAAPISSASFREPNGHENPTGAWPEQSQEKWSNGLSLGIYKLPDDLVAKFSVAETVQIPADWPQSPALSPTPSPSPVPSIAPQPTPTNETALASRRLQEAAVLQPPPAFNRQTLIATGDDYLRTTTETTIGAMRISFKRAKYDQASVLAEQYRGSFQEWTGDEKHKVQEGYHIYDLFEGVYTAQQMFEYKVFMNKFATWAYRILFLILAWLGLSLAMSILSVMPDVIPFAGPFLGDMVGCMLNMAMFGIALCYSLVIGAIAWLRFRPFHALVLLLMASAGAGLYVYMRGKSKRISNRVSEQNK